MTFDYSKYGAGNFVKFENVGDKVVGIIKHIRDGKDFNGNPCPELILEVNDQGDEQTVTVSQVRLLSLFRQQAPQEGDKIRIEYTAVGPASPGKAPAKEFTLEVKPGPHALAVPGPADEAPF